MEQFSFLISYYNQKNRSFKKKKKTITNKKTHKKECEFHITNLLLLLLLNIKKVMSANIFNMCPVNLLISRIWRLHGNLRGIVRAFQKNC